MQPRDIVIEIQRLPLIQRFFVVEETIKSIKKEEMQHQMELAANELYEDYLKDKELNAFTSLDFEAFYETWAGSISKETAKKMLQHVEQSRNQWERKI